MANKLIVHTPLPLDEPKYHGEYLVAQKLTTLDSLTGEAWFNIDHLPNVTELDLAYFHKNAGLYLIEIKSIEIDQIQKYDKDQFILKGNAKRQHPVQQIKHGSIKLREHFQRVIKEDKRKTEVPFIQYSVLWPLITKKEWREKFTDPNVRIQADSMLFKEDIASARNWVDALQNLWTAPLGGVVPHSRVRGEHEGMNLFREICSKHVSEQKPEPINTESLKPVKESKNLAEEFAPGVTHKGILEGPPGTGKTTVLREIALSHAAAGAAVLHVCFNKVLAADQRREYEALKRSEMGFIDVHDEWEFFASFKASIGIKDKGGIAQKIRAAIDDLPPNSIVLYDTILIDESQDLDQDLFESLQLVARPNASWILAYGEGQEIYNFGPGIKNPCNWVEEFRKVAKRKSLRRSFRNTTRAFLIGQTFWENFPNLEKSTSFIEEKLKQVVQPEITMELDLQLPRTKNDFRINYLPSKNEAFEAAYRTLLIEVIEDSINADRGKDVMVVVGTPTKTGELKGLSSYEIVKAISEDLALKFGYEVFDIVDKNNRRNVPKIRSIRIVNHQQVRGLSASHVIVLDLELLEFWCNDDLESHPPFRNLGYVSLSRSKASTIVGFRKQIDNEVERFLTNSLEHYIIKDIAK